MDAPIFKVLALGPGECSWERQRESVERVKSFGELLLEPFARQHRVYCNYCAGPDGDWIAFYLSGVKQLDLFRNSIDMAEQDAEIEADHMVRRQMRALRDLVGELAVKPTQFWRILRNHGIAIDDLAVLSSGRRRRAGKDLVCVHTRGVQGQTVVPLADLPTLFPSETPLELQFSVANVNTSRARGRATHFVELPIAPICKRLTLTWKPEVRWTVAQRLLEASDSGPGIWLTAYPALNGRGELARLHLIEFITPKRPVVLRQPLGSTGWFGREWPMPHSDEEQTRGADDQLFRDGD